MHKYKRVVGFAVLVALIAGFVCADQADAGGRKKAGQGFQTFGTQPYNGS